MTDRNDQIPGCLGVLLILLGLWALVAIARGQSEDDGLILARLTVHEAGFDSPADASLIHAVLSGIVERDHVSYRRAAALAAPRWSAGRTSRPWTLELHEDGRTPRGWRGARWSAYRERWGALLEHARRVVRGEIPSTCSSSPRVWGSRADVARGRARGSVWRDAGCAGTRNLGGRWD